MIDNGLTTAREELEQVMSNLSELAYRAGWMMDTEYRLWAFMSDVNDDGEWGLTDLEPHLRADLARLSEQIGGWICWADSNEYRAASGTRFVRAADWEKRYALWKAAQLRINPSRSP